MHRFGLQHLFLLALLALVLPNLVGATEWFQVQDVNDDDVLNIRQAPDFRSAKIGELHHDARCVQTFGCESGWCRVAAEDGQGWVRDLFLRAETLSCDTTELAAAAAPDTTAPDTDIAVEPRESLLDTNPTETTMPLSQQATSSAAADLLIGATELLCNSYLLLSQDPTIDFVQSARLLFDTYQIEENQHSDSIGRPLISIRADTAYGTFYADYFGADANGIRCSGSLLTDQQDQQSQLSNLMRYPAATERLGMVASKSLQVEDILTDGLRGEQLVGYSRYFGQSCDSISIKTSQVQFDDGALLATLTYALSGSLPPPLANCTH